MLAILNKLLDNLQFQTHFGPPIIVAQAQGVLIESLFVKVVLRSISQHPILYRRHQDIAQK